MPSVHPVRAWVAVTKEEWERFRALATIASSDGAHLLAHLVRGELARQGVQLELPDEPVATEKATGRSRSRRTPVRAEPQQGKRRESRSKGTVAPVARRRARKELPVVSDALVAREAARGAAASKRRRSSKRGTIAAEGADQHELVLAKANKRSVSTKKGRPTRRRSS